MPNKNKCSTCGRKFEKKQITEVNDTKEVLPLDIQELIANVKKQVLTEVQTSIEPLLIKLKEITDHRNQSTQSVNSQSVQQDQLQQMQIAAQERLKTREQNIKLRMNRWQNRIKKRQ